MLTRNGAVMDLTVTRGRNPLHSPVLKVVWSLWMNSKHKIPPLRCVSLELSLPVELSLR